MTEPPNAAPLTPYAGYDVLAKWDSASFDDVTRRVLHERLHGTPPRRFFSPDEFTLLEAACARLLATGRGQPPIANWIDADLFEGRNEGFRHPDMPPDDVAWRHGLAGLRAEARRRFHRGFAELDDEQQDNTLRALQRDDVDARAFGCIAPSRFFTDLLLKAAAGHFYGRPEAWSEIGFGGPASPRGYVRLALDKRDPWEAPWPHAEGIESGAAEPNT